MYMTNLSDYVGCDFNEDTHTEIEKKFNPYKITICVLNKFYLEIFRENQIRCVVVNGKIDKIQFN
jgi:hypothetical protein